MTAPRVHKYVYNDVTLEVARQFSKAEARELEAAGFTVDKVIKSQLVRLVIPRDKLHYADLLGVKALCHDWVDGLCTLRLRMFVRDRDDFQRIHQSLRADGWVYNKESTSWSKRCSELDYHKLCSIETHYERRLQYEERQRQQAEVMAQCERRDERWRARYEAWHTLSSEPGYLQASHDYGQLLLSLQANGVYEVGSDGAPNWPAPPCVPH